MDLDDSLISWLFLALMSWGPSTQYPGLLRELDGDNLSVAREHSA